MTVERKRQNWKMQTDELTAVNRLSLKMGLKEREVRNNLIKMSE